MRKLTFIALPALLFVTACGGGGGDDLSKEDKEYVDAAMATFDAEEAEPLTEEDARCIVTSMVDTVGSERLTEMGITPETFGSDDDSPFPEGFTEKEANGIVDGFDGCIDLGGLFTDSMAEDDSMDAETKKCLEDAFDDKLVRKLFVTMLTKGEDALEEDSELMSEFFAIFSKCPGALGG